MMKQKEDSPRPKPKEKEAKKQVVQLVEVPQGRKEKNDLDVRAFD